MSQDVLNLQNLSVYFGATAVVQNLNLQLARGESLGIVGESGSGKSLTALAIMQLLPPTASVSQQSHVFWQGQDLLDTPEQKMRHIRGKKISMIFQDALSALNPVFTIGNQMLETLHTHGHRQKKQAKAIALEFLREVGLQDPEQCFGSYPHQLSGGMRQRAMIATAICCQPEILIADEPTTALDVTIQAQIISLLQKLQRDHNMSLIFISHDLAIVSQLADNIIVMEKGKMVEQASASDFFSQPQHPYSKKLLAAIPSTSPQRQQASSNPCHVEVQQLKVYFPIQKGIFKRTVGYIKAVDDISFALVSGETLALVGESGSGKTTTGKAILNLIHRTGGQLLLDGQAIGKFSFRQWRKLRQRMQIIFQDPFSALNPRLLVVDSIAEGLITQGKVRNRKYAIPIIDELLKEVDLPLDVKWRYPHEFSGGERQRICIARALALQPEVLVLDEPTSALDVSIQMQVLKLLQRLQREHRLTYLLITHDIGVVAFLAQQVAVMYQGKIVEQGSCQRVLTQPQQDYTKKLLASVPTIQHERGAA